MVISVYGAKEAAQNGFKVDNQFLNTETFLTVVGFAAYTYEGIGLIIPIMETTNRPDLYPYILISVLVLLNSIFVVFGALMYFSFGREKVSSSPLITDILPSEDIAITIIEVIWIFNVVVTFPLVFHPAHRVFESYAYAKLRDSKTKTWMKNISRSLFVALVVILSVTLNDTLDKLESINGAFACIPMAFILP